MREIYKTYSLKGKKQMKTTTFSVALLVVATLVLGSAIPAFAITNNTTKLNVDVIRDESISAGPKPTSISPSLISSNAQPSPITDDCWTMYGYTGWGTEETVWFTTCDLTLNAFGDPINSNTLSAGTFGCDQVWYAVTYDSGLLYGIDIWTGEMWSVGGGGNGLNALSYDPTTNRMFGVHSPSASPGQDELYEIDPDTGDQEYIGKLGGSVYYTIGCAFDAEGTLYGWDVVTDDIFTIDTETGALTVVADLTVNLNWGQDGDFHRETDVLYLTATLSSAQTCLVEVDEDTGECTILDYFSGNPQITASCFENSCVPPEHDIGIRSIENPSTGPAVPSMPMELLVKNYGNNTETFNAQMEVIKCEAGPLIMEEYFDGATFPPEGWETDDWKLSYTNVAGGDSPEARVYRYDYSDYYDNYLQTNTIDCTGLEKVNLRFKWASDLYNGLYTSFYIKFRRNLTSPWVDVTPWDNPLGSSADPDAYEIGCYGFGEPMGEEFQIKFEYIGYYYYFYYFWLDDVTLEACGGCAEYAELIEYITLDSQQEMLIEFPGWPPSEWQNETSENTWEEYPIHAWIELDGDENARNDDRWKLIDLWYPWMHDMALWSIDSPHDEEGRILPAQTFPVEATMKNAGQYAECCIPIEIMIGEPIILDTLMEEYDWPGSTYYPGQTNGWQDQHKSVAYYYGWRRYYGSYSGGDPYEAYLLYYYARADMVFYSAAVDTTGAAGLKLEFLSYINHYYGQGLYTLQAGYSYDAKTWYAAWSVDPGSSQGFDVSVPIEGGHDTLYIGFWCKGNPYYMNYWYIDNVRLVETGLVEEFADNACQGPDIEPGEYVTFQFDDWTPDFLQYETSHPGIEYLAQANIYMDGDKNPGNDILQESLVLKYWHDVGIDAVTSPINAGGMKDFTHWDNGEPDGRNGLAGSMYSGYENLIIDDFNCSEEILINKAEFRYVWNSAYTENMETCYIFIFEETGTCSPAYTEYAKLEAIKFEEVTTGDYYFSRPEISCTVEFPDVYLAPGEWWIGFMPVGIQDNIAYLLTAENQRCVFMANLNYWGIPKWTDSWYWGDDYDLSWRIYQITGPPDINAYIQPGAESIEALAKNYGTFPERDLICSANVQEFITDPDFGTEIWSGAIGPFNIMTPLGGTYALDFGSCTFPEEGRYGLYLSMPDGDDDETLNNAMKYGIGVDDSHPDSIATLNPTNPDGLEGWYVSDLEILVEATDPLVMNVSSGVREIRYTINGGADVVVAGDTATIVITEDGKDIQVAYWAVDNVGNAEPKHQEIVIDMDQTPPDLEMSYEQVETNPPELLVTVNATDAMSGMNRVEFNLNDVLQDTVSGVGPVYQWSFIYYGVLNIHVTGIAFDEAGNSDELVIDEFEVIIPCNVSNQHSSNNTPRG
jgi:hypothetical protein